MSKKCEYVSLEVFIQKIDHPGLIASMIRYMGIQTFFDNHLTKSMRPKTWHTRECD